MLLSRLKYWREYRALSLRQLADKAKIPYSAISLLENGKREPQGRTVHRLAAALDVQVYELFEQTPAAQVITQPLNSNKTITLPRARVRAKKQPASVPVVSFWVIDEDDTLGPLGQVEAERLKGKLGRARVYEAASRSEADKQHIAFLREVARGHEVW